MDDYSDYKYDENVDYIDWWAEDSNDYLEIEDNWWSGDESQINSQQPMMQKWFNEQAMPFYNFHKNEVYNKALERGNEEFGPLLDTCREGSECRL